MTRCFLISSLALLPLAFAGPGDLKRDRIEPFLDE